MLIPHCNCKSINLFFVLKMVDEKIGERFCEDREEQSWRGGVLGI